MNKIELVQQVGNEVCEDCGPNADCGENPAECSRVENATALLDHYISPSASITTVEADGMKPCGCPITQDRSAFCCHFVEGRCEHSAA